MREEVPSGCTAFEGCRRVASGDLASVIVSIKEVLDRDESAAVLIFDDSTSRPIEIDTRGTVEEVLQRIAAQPHRGAAVVESVHPEPVERRGPGRPRLGVVAREITLLPRHWEWLGSQPGGASVALRRLVEEARRINAGRDRVRLAQESTFRFMTAMAGNEPGFEEATRALFAGSRERFDEQTARWPSDVRDHAMKLAAVAFAGPPETATPRTPPPRS